MNSPVRPSRTPRAVLAIVISVLALSLGDAVIKATGLSLPLWQMYVLRSALTVPVLLVIVYRQGSVIMHAPGWVVLRSGLLVAMWLSYYASLPLMPLSLAAAAYYTGPLFIVGISALLAGRWPTTRTLFAIVGGFLGVVLIVRPDTSGFQVAALLPVIAAFLYACAMVLTSVKCREDDPMMLALALNIAFIVAGCLLGLFSGQPDSFIFGPWRSLDAALLGTVGVLALLILVGGVGAAFAYQNGHPSTIAAFDYTYLVFSFVWGMLFFGECPGQIALVGIGLIAAAGFLALPRRR